MWGGDAIESPPQARADAKDESYAGSNLASRARPRKIFFFVSEDWFFCSHFLERALAARDAGHDVAVVTRVGEMGERIRSSGVRLLPLDLRRRSLNPIRELGVIKRLVSLYRSERPDLVQHVAIKPIVYGTIAAKLARVPAMINAPVGMGYVFSSQERKARLVRPFVIWLYRLLMCPRNGFVIVENPDDGRMLADLGIADSRRIRLIRGAGVDVQRFQATPEQNGTRIIVLPSRMLWDKGIREFVDAARELRRRGVRARFVLVGVGDPGNPASISENQLRAWEAEGVVEWWGFREDMPAVYTGSHIVCLPSYREGLPKSLIEAAACGRPIVTTDVPGCREVVRDGENGLLVPARDVAALVEGLQRLIQDAPLRQRMGIRGRAIAEAEFSAGLIASQTIDVYRELLAPAEQGKRTGQ